MPATLIHHVLPENDGGTHTFHVFGPQTKAAVDDLTSGIVAILEYSQISGSASDYARLTIETDDEAAKVETLAYLKLWDGGGDYLMRLYRHNGESI